MLFGLALAAIPLAVFVTCNAMGQLAAAWLEVLTPREIVDETLRASGKIKDRDSVVCLLTASGLKDPATAEAALPAKISVSADLTEARATLRDVGLFPG